MKKLLFLFILLPLSAHAVDIILTIDDTTAQRALNAFCAHFQYQDLVPDPNDSRSVIPNPITKIQFAKQQIAIYVKGIVVSEEAKNAASAAQGQALDQAQRQISITSR